MSKYKIEPDEKIRTVEGILNGKETQRHAAARLGVAHPYLLLGSGDFNHKQPL